MLISSFLSNFALSWALATMISKPHLKQDGYKLWAVVAFNVVVLLTLTAYIPIVFVKSFDVQWREMTEVDAILFYYFGLACWAIFVLPQALITIHELRRKR